MAYWKWSSFSMWLAWKLPRSVVYWAVIRATAYATQGKWGTEDPTAIGAMKVVERWTP